MEAASGTFEAITPTNRRIETESCEIYEVRDKLVARGWEHGDPAEASAQLTSGVPL